MTLKPGSKAPKFNLKNQDDELISLENLLDQKIILYFYPKDDTSGCTKQAEAFSERKSEFDQHNCHIIGISKDSVKSHKKFQEKYNLNFTLLSDPETKTNQEYGAWKEKSMYGKKYFGTERTTFLIDKNGTIDYVWPKVKVSEHIDNILNYLKQ